MRLCVLSGGCVLSITLVVLAAPRALAQEPAEGAAAAAAEVAVLPVVAQGLLPSARDTLDADIRKAVASFGYAVQPAAQTRAHLDEGTTTGLDCRLTEDACALRVGLIADVSAVLVTTVELVGERMLLRGAWLVVDGVDGESRHIASEIKMPAQDGGRMLRAALGRLVTGRGEATPLPVDVTVAPGDARLTIDGDATVGPRVWLVPGPHRMRVEAVGHEPIERTLVIAADGSQAPLAFALTPTVRVQEASTIVYVGAAMAAVGGFLALGGAGVAGVVEAQLQSGSVPRAERADRTTLGVTGLVFALAGLTAAAGGGALVWAGAP